MRGGAGKGCRGRHTERQREVKTRGGEHRGRAMREDREASRGQSSPGKSGLYSESSGENSHRFRERLSQGQILEESLHLGAQEAWEGGMQTGRVEGHGMCMRAAAVGTEKAGKGKESVGRQTVLPDAG